MLGHGRALDDYLREPRLKVNHVPLVFVSAES